ncbi:MAG: HEAT repeat domain-containing protein [Oligoflexia bacterium]|nr:HEAT repeat domain-containing protein [Oligoflexia bacterium]MBF0364569.1 HEAT repeat domain-containing protein [Oligoflexia bacterium]
MRVKTITIFSSAILFIAVLFFSYGDPNSDLKEEASEVASEHLCQTGWGSGQKVSYAIEYASHGSLVLADTEQEYDFKLSGVLEFYHLPYQLHALKILAPKVEMMVNKQRGEVAFPSELSMWVGSDGVLRKGESGRRVNERILEVVWKSVWGEKGVVESRQQEKKRGRLLREKRKITGGSVELLIGDEAEGSLPPMLAKVQLQESAGASGASGEAKTTILLKAKACRELAKTQVAQEISRFKEASKLMENRENNEYDQDQQLYAKIAKEKLFSQLLSEVEAEFQRGGEINKFHHYLKAHLLSGDGFEELMKRLAELASDDKRFEFLASTLVSTGTRAAQQAMLTLLAEREQRGDERAMLLLIPQFALKNTPIRESIDYLRKLEMSSERPNVRKLSALTLGMSVHKLSAADADPSLAEEILQQKITRLKVARSDKERVDRLYELGNTGAPAIVSLMAPYLKSGRSEMRAVAVGQLRLVQSSEAQQLIMSSLLHDPDRDVRSEAMNSLRQQKISHENQRRLQERFLTEREEKLRAHILQTLWDYRQSNPEVLPLVKQVIASDRRQDSIVARVANSLMISEVDHQ